MNRLARDAFPGEPLQQQPPQQAEDEIDLRKIFAVLRRNWPRLALGVLVGLLLAVAQLSTTTRLYTAHVDIAIGRSADVETFQDFSGVGGRAAEIQIETELLVLGSEQIARRVVRMLALHENPRFMETQPTLMAEVLRLPLQGVSMLMDRAREFLSGDLPDAAALEQERADSEARAVERAVGRLRGGMRATSMRGSRVLRVSYTSSSPQLSAQIANAIAQAYIEDQLEATDAASQRAIDWLRQRRDELRLQLEQVARIAERFREENGLVGVDVDLLASAELERLTRDLVAARAEVVALEARDRYLTEIVERADTTAVVRETESQGITAGLRARYLEVLRSYNNLAATLGEDHAQTQRRLRELQEIEALMFEEVRRSAQLVQQDLRAARERVTSLEVAQSRVGERVGADQAVVLQLRDLERNVETVRNLYTSFQQRHQEATQRQEIPVSNARVLNRALPPGAPSAPDGTRMLAFGGLLGLLFAGGWVAFREWRDDKVRSEEQVRAELGLEYLGGLTVIRGRSNRVRRSAVATAGADGEVALPTMLTFAADNPLSNFAETLRTGKMSLTLRHGQATRAPRVGFVSCFPAEGKTTVAANFAALLAQQGARVVLIDGDLRNPGLTQSTGQSFETGLVDVLLGETDWREVVHQVSGTGVTLIPNGKARVAHSAELLGGAGMRDLLDRLDQEYDHVILDLPPLGPVVDARAILDRLDGVFFVLKWGGTNLEMARRILRMDPRMRDKCYGAFLNFFDPKKARAYGDAEGYGYHRSYYGRYYRET
jgi:succinoglycan biosynthesis transport protein ExoP